jgi:hypothetical protein
MLPFFQSPRPVIGLRSEFFIFSKRTRNSRDGLCVPKESEYNIIELDFRKDALAFSPALPFLGAG